MFAPNNIPEYSHRDPKFRDILSELQDTCLNIANMNKETDIVLFISGSGTLANEIVLTSLKSNIAINTKTVGEFSTRLTRTYNTTKHRDTVKDQHIDVYVQYETGESKVYKNNIQYNSFTDAVSAFPYYPAPNSRVWTTVASKQFGSETGLSLIFIRDYKTTLSELFQNEEHSYLSLAKYVNKYVNFKETPNTPAITSISSFNKILKSFNIESFRSTINRRRHNFIKCYDMQLIGDGPVLTFQNLPSSIIQMYNIYKNGGKPQIFLWSGNEQQYNIFKNDLLTQRDIVLSDAQQIKNNINYRKEHIT